MFFMAYSPQPTVAVDSNYCSGNARLDQGKGRRALRRRPCPATACSRPVPLLSLRIHWVAPSTWLTPLRAGMK
jgi:hypothetical protein